MSVASSPYVSFPSTMEQTLILDMLNGVSAHISFHLSSSLDIGAFDQAGVYNKPPLILTYPVRN